MGRLEIWHHPTKLFAKAADHTYVRCENGGKVWGCWGGNEGGQFLRRGRGSTTRADAIAEENERAGISHYLVNGVCHQAANRIVIGAGITVRGARGSGVSEAIFGVYGRQLWGPYHGRFDAHEHVSGEVPECARAAFAGSPVNGFAINVDDSGDDAQFVRQSLTLYRDAPRPPIAAGSRGSTTSSEYRAWRASVAVHHSRLFDLWARHRLTQNASEKRLSALEELRGALESEQLDIAAETASDPSSNRSLVVAMNDLTLRFQREAKNLVSDTEYLLLFDLMAFEDEIILFDPDSLA